MPEIIICGGSLAGLSAAIRLKQLGHDPLVLEKAKFPRAKLCGEFLGPDAFPVLARLGLLEQILKTTDGRVENAFFYNRKSEKLTIPMRWLSRRYPFGVAIPRKTLDTLMLAHARSLSIQVVEQARVQPSVLKAENRFTLCVHQQSGEVQYQADILVDATGRHGGLKTEANTKQHPQKNRTHKTLGLQCHIRCEKIPDFNLRMYLFPGGYGGIQPIAPGLANLCMLLNTVPENLRQTDFHLVMRQTFSQNAAAHDYIQYTEPVEPFNTTANLNLMAERSKLLQIGDARLTVDPFTGSGMAQALETGYLAAEVIHQGILDKLSYSAIQRRYQRLYARQFAFRLEMLKWFRPVLFSGAMQTASWPAVKMLSPYLAALFR